MAEVSAGELQTLIATLQGIAQQLGNIVKAISGGTFLAPAPGAALSHLTAAGSQLLKSGAGYVTSINVNTAATNGSLTIYDGINASGRILAVIDVSKNGAAGGVAPWSFSTGLFVSMTGAADVTIVFH